MLSPVGRPVHFKQTLKSPDSDVVRLLEHGVVVPCECNVVIKKQNLVESEGDLETSSEDLEITGRFRRCPVLEWRKPWMCRCAVPWSVVWVYLRGVNSTSDLSGEKTDIA